MQASGSHCRQHSFSRCAELLAGGVPAPAHRRLDFSTRENSSARDGPEVHYIWIIQKSVLYLDHSFQVV